MRQPINPPSQVPRGTPNDNAMGVPTIATASAGIVACIHRAVAAGKLPATVIPETLAAAFDSFLLGLSTLARDGVPYATLDAAVTQMMGLWDSLRSVADDQ
ncbi:TetR family transcriptional regulator [Pseudomonas amygdali pv. mori str. 301020]|uniref:TetR family transcriptional regulator n=1 Tax=Pseudomonas amygdali pv. mori str. 301020 TaxID=629261 RepID=A0A656GGM8_PSEA0|nr:TetR family transcriptional regulator [Pseudomonas amygdali pv. mori str. 301020]